MEPQSNADIVALNLVHHAVIDDILVPGEPIAALFDSMAAMARNMGGERRAASSDWKDAISRCDPAEVPSLSDRQLQAAEEVWAQQWMLTMVAKHLYEMLHQLCLDFPVPLESIEYDPSGKPKSWKRRPS